MAHGEADGSSAARVMRWLSDSLKLQLALLGHVNVAQRWGSAFMRRGGMGSMPIHVEEVDSAATEWCDQLGHELRKV